MKLEEFTDTHKATLKSWFDKGHTSNNFIGYYAKLEEWLRLVNGTQRIAYAATVDGKMVGFVDLELDNRNGASFAFGIDPTLRGQGLGTELVREIEVTAKKHGATTLNAGVEADNIVSQKVLEKAGYSTTTLEGGMVEYTKELRQERF